MHPCVGAVARHSPQRPSRLNSGTGNGGGGRWRGDDGDGHGLDPSCPARNCHLPETRAQAWTPPSHGSQAGTCRAVQRPPLPWDGTAVGAKRDPPARTTRMLLSASRSQGSSRPTTGLHPGDLRLTTTAMAAERPTCIPPFLNHFFHKSSVSPVASDTA